MKKCLCLMAASIVMVGCNDSLEFNPSIEAGEGVYATIEQPDYSFTKALNFTDGKLSFEWAAGDQIMVYGSDASAIYKVGADGSSVTKLESESFTLNDNTTYYTFSPVVGTLSEAAKEAINVSFDGQIQSANSSTEHLRLNQYACATATVENNAVNFNFLNQVAWVHYSHKFTKAVKAAKVVMSVTEGNPFVLKGTLNATEGISEKGFNTSITATETANEISLALGEDGIDIAFGTSLDAFLTIHPVDLTGKIVTIKVLDASGNVLTSDEYVGRPIKRNAFVSFTQNSQKVDDVVKYNGKYYTSLQEAVWDCKDDTQEMVVLKDMELITLQLETENKVLLNLNGHTVNITGNGYYHEGVTMEGSSRLTIKGSGSFGDVAQNNISTLFYVSGNVTAPGATLTIEGDATYYSANECAYARKSTASIYIKGGKWIGGPQYTLNKLDSEQEAIISVTGGEFYKYNPAASESENPIANFVADGYGVIKDGDWYKVVKAVEVADEAGLRGAAKQANAVVNVSESIVLTEKNVSMADNTSLYIAKDATVSANFKGTSKCTFTYLNKGGMITGEGTIMAPEKSDPSTAAVSFDSRNKELIIDGNITIKGGKSGYYNGDKYVHGCSPAIFLYDGTLIINGGHFISGTDNEYPQESSPAVYVWSNSKLNNARLIINGGVFESATEDATFLINMDDNNLGPASIQIMGGTFVGFNPADNTTDGEHTNYVPDGYVSTQTTYNGKTAWVVSKK